MESKWSESWSQYNGLINKDDVVVKDVRYEFPYGWGIVYLQFYNFEEADIYSKETDFGYLSEESLIEDYPDSISIEDAFNLVKNDRFYKKRLDNYIKKYNEKYIV